TSPDSRMRSVSGISVFVGDQLAAPVSKQLGRGLKFWLLLWRWTCRFPLRQQHGQNVIRYTMGKRDAAVAQDYNGQFLRRYEDQRRGHAAHPARMRDYTVPILPIRRGPAYAIAGIVSSAHGRFMHGVDGSVGEDRLLIRQVRFQVEQSEANQVMRAGVDGGSAAMVEIIKRDGQAVGAISYSLVSL